MTTASNWANSVWKKRSCECGNGSAADILSRLTLLVDQWLGGNNQDDDITIIVMKAK